jgi:NADH-quinone oxidoreductase subunit A
METAPVLIALSPWEPAMFSLGVYTLLVLLLLVLILFLASWLGEKKPSPDKLRPYECGVIPTGSAQLRYPVPFYLVAAYFLIFDVETVIVFIWAIAFKPLGWIGWWRITFFIVVLLLSLFYIWKKGGLEWGPVTRLMPLPPKKRIFS